MKKQKLSTSLLFMLFSLMTITFTSCNNDDDSPVTPVDETGSELGHDEWAKVTFRFTRGHSHGSTFHGAPENDEVQYFKASEEISYEYDDNGNLISTGEDAFHLIKGELYAFEINYYDHDGENISGEFTTDEMSPLHQHFFLTKNAKELNSDTPFSNASNILESYTYRDTNPWNGMFTENGVELLDNNPIGLKGYFTIGEVYTQFDLNVILVHIVNGTKYDTDGNPYPFNAPNPAFLGTQDLNIKIPVRVFTSRPGYTEGDFEVFIQDIANEFNTTYEDAEADWEKAVDTPFEGSDYWM